MSKGFTNVRHSAFDIQYSIFKIWISFALIDLVMGMSQKQKIRCPMQMTGLMLRINTNTLQKNGSEAN